ncbi:MAG: glycosyltransferase family 2 protein [Flavobacteriales bacterium]|nr:glycosyltransferase family 2 protein [Flavobacteriales bacterium]
MMDLVSVIIPTFDRKEALLRAVRSCLEQSHAVHEVLVCDDGSTDGSREAILALDIAQVKWIGGERAGRPAVPRNRGINAATGHWLAFLDSDDAWVPEKLAAQLKLMERSRCKASCSNAERIMPDQRSGGPYFTEKADRFGLRDLLYVNRVICSSAVVEREVMLETGGFPEAPEMRAIEDHAAWLRVTAHTELCYSPEPLVRYTDDAKNSIRKEDVPVSAQRERVLNDLLSWGGSTAFSMAQRSAIARALKHAREGTTPSRMERLFRW